MKPTLIVYGNCQGQALQTVLRSIKEVTDVYEIVYLRSFVHPTELDTHASSEEWGRCALLFEQVSSWSKPFATDLLPPNAERIAYPAIDMAILWPTQDSSGHIHNKPEPGFEYGKYPYGDRVINEILREGLSGEAAWEAYQERASAELSNYPRRAEIEAQRWLSLDDLSESSVHKQILAEMPQHRPAFTYNHPTSRVLRAIFREAFGKSHELANLGFDVEAALKRELSHEPYDNVQVPIHPIVAEKLMLEWWSPQMVYRMHDRGSWDFEQSMRRWIDSV